MSLEFALCLTLITFGSCYACYRLGSNEERERWLKKRRHYLRHLREEGEMEE